MSLKSVPFALLIPLIVTLNILMEHRRPLYVGFVLKVRSFAAPRIFSKMLTSTVPNSEIKPAENFTVDEDLYAYCRRQAPTIDTLAFEKTYDHSKTVTTRYRKALTINRNNCTEVDFSVDPLPKTILGSIPGAGNTWARHLIELITGVYTGAVYNDSHLVNNFPGEDHAGSDVVVVKTHEADIDKAYKRAVILIRDPLASIKADHMRLQSQGNHTGFDKKIGLKGWRAAVKRETELYGNRTWKWLQYAQKNELDLFLLFYDDLTQHLDRALANLAYFLGFELSSETLKCALRNREGSYHRSKEFVDPFEGFEVDMNKIDEHRVKSRLLIKQCIKEKTCGTSGCAFAEF